MLKEIRPGLLSYDGILFRRAEKLTGSRQVYFSRTQCLKIGSGGMETAYQERERWKRIPQEYKKYFCEILDQGSVRTSIIERHQFYQLVPKIKGPIGAMLVSAQQTDIEARKGSFTPQMLTERYWQKMLRNPWISFVRKHKEHIRRECATMRHLVQDMGLRDIHTHNWIWSLKSHHPVVIDYEG